MLLLPTALSCAAAILVQLQLVRSRQKVSATSLPATLFEHSMPPCSTSWPPSTAAADAVRLEGITPCALTVIQVGVGLLRAEPKAKDVVLLEVTLLRSRKHTCRAVCACSLRRTAKNHSQLGCQCWLCTGLRSGLASAQSAMLSLIG
jgi:hypothetical protein